MEWPSVKILLWILLVFLQVREHRGCFEEERIGLLELKAFLKSQLYRDHLLPSWIDDAKSDCCAWKRVTCNSSTGHMVEISLENVNETLYYYPLHSFKDTMYEEGWSLNVSLFLPFKELKSLDLSGNAINGCFRNEGFEKLSRLKSLRILNLGYNYLYGDNILQSLDAVISLKTLDVTDNRLQGYFPTQGLANLSNLEVLMLPYNEFNGPLPIAGLTNLNKLEILDLRGNQFIGSISPSLKALSSLKAISLAGNLLNGTLPTQELCALKKLEELDISSNFFDGILPPCLKNMTSIKLLDVSWNQFSGIIPSGIIANLTLLEYIGFSHNHFEGQFSFNLFSNHSKLDAIMFGPESNNFEIEFEDLVNWDFPFQLKILELLDCNLNSFDNILKFLVNQHELEVIDLSHNHLNTNFPTHLLENKSRLQVLILQNNSFVGKFHFKFDQHLHIKWLDVSYNDLDGQLQEDIGKLTPNLQYLNLSRNHFGGYLPSSIGDMSDLEHMDLSYNNFLGELPKGLIANCTSLIDLKLNNNHLHGEIFSKHFKLQYLETLVLRNNQFKGTLPISSPWSAISVLDISNNCMLGTIPEWIGNSTIFSVLLSNNFFEGAIPCGRGSASLIDFSHNSLSGSLLPCLNFKSVDFLNLQGNKLTGSIPTTIFYPTKLLTLDLRDNGFSGSIPDEIGAFSNLRVLQLSGNRLSGIIPNRLCWLKRLNIMDLSRNLLSGTIPLCFHNISFGKIVDDVADGLVADFHNYLGPEFQRLLKWNGERVDVVYGSDIKEVKLEFVTKYRSYIYNGDILNHMSGLDFSCNKLIGQIPLELGELSSIQALNLSHNQLTGSISETFSKLANLESLDLSYNNLSGKIPLVLIDLSFLEVFTVAYNNLSGKVPEMKNQFATFEKSSYEGNPFLCGLPLQKNCTTTSSEPHPLLKKYSNAFHHEFFTCFTPSYIIFFLSVVSLLYINLHWQQWCFNLIKTFMYRCHHSIFDILKGL